MKYVIFFKVNNVMNLQEEYPYFHPSGYIFVKVNIKDFRIQPAFTCSKSEVETPEQCVKPVQS